MSAAAVSRTSTYPSNSQNCYRATANRWWCWLRPVEVEEAADKVVEEVEDKCSSSSSLYTRRRREEDRAEAELSPVAEK